MRFMRSKLTLNPIIGLLLLTGVSLAQYEVHVTGAISGVSDGAILVYKLNRPIRAQNSSQVWVDVRSQEITRTITDASSLDLYFVPNRGSTSDNIAVYPDDTYYEATIADTDGSGYSRILVVPCCGPYVWGDIVKDTPELPVANMLHRTGDISTGKQTFAGSTPIRIVPSALGATPVVGDIEVDSADSNKLKVWDGSSWVSSGGVSGAIAPLSVTSGNVSLSMETSSGLASNSVAMYIDSTKLTPSAANIQGVDGVLSFTGNVSISGDATVGGGNLYLTGSSISNSNGIVMEFPGTGNVSVSNDMTAGNITSSGIISGDASGITNIPEAAIVDLTPHRGATAPLSVVSNNTSLSVWLGANDPIQLLDTGGTPLVYFDSTKVTITESQVTDLQTYLTSVSPSQILGQLPDPQKVLVGNGVEAPSTSDTIVVGGLLSPTTSGTSTTISVTATTIEDAISLANLSSRDYGDLTGIPASFAPSAHESSHRTGGSDAVSVTTLLGQHTDPQTILAGNGVESPAAVDTILTGGLLSPTTSGTSTTISVTATTISDAIGLSDYANTTGNVSFAADITATNGYFTTLYGDGSNLTGISGAGDVTGPGSSVDNEVVRFDSTTGKVIQSGAGTTISDAGLLTTASVSSTGGGSFSFVTGDGRGLTNLQESQIEDLSAHTVDTTRDATAPLLIDSNSVSLSVWLGANDPIQLLDIDGNPTLYLNSSKVTPTVLNLQGDLDDLNIALGSSIADGPHVTGESTLAQAPLVLDSLTVSLTHNPDSGIILDAFNRLTLDSGRITTTAHLSASNATDLTDSGDSTLHYHATDRAVANATGTLADLNTALSSSIDESSDTRTPTAGSVGLASFDTDVSDMKQIFNGFLLDRPSITVASDGADITLTVEKSGGGDLRSLFSTGLLLVDTTPATTTTLTEGTDEVPQRNYVYILRTSGSFEVSTSGWPAAEHVAIADILCQSAASLQTDGAYKLQTWDDHTVDGNSLGSLSYVNKWIRSQPSTFIDGVACTPSVGAATFDIAVATGTIEQLFNQDFPAFNTATGSEVMMVNDPATAYKRVGNLTGELTDANSGSMSGKYYNLVVWGAVSEDEADCQVMVNLPTSSYSNESSAIVDSSSTAVYAIPSAFRGSGFLIARLTVKHAAGGGGTWTLSRNTDLRGLTPGVASGASGSGGASQLTELSDVDTATQTAGFGLFSDGGNYYGRQPVEADIADLVHTTARAATAPLEISSNNVSLTVFLPVEGINQLVTVDGKTHLYADSSKVTVTESQITDLSHTVDTTRDATAPLEIDTNNVSLTVFLPVDGINQLVTVDGKTHLYADSSKVTVTESQITDLGTYADTTGNVSFAADITAVNGYFDTLTGDGSRLTGISAGGDVTGPGSSVDNEVVRFDSTTGKIIQSGAGTTISDAGLLTTASVSSTGGGSFSFVTGDGRGLTNLQESQIEDLVHTTDTTRDATAPLEIDTNNVSLTIWLGANDPIQLLDIDSKPTLYMDSSKVTITEAQITDLQTYLTSVSLNELSGYSTTNSVSLTSGAGLTIADHLYFGSNAAIGKNGDTVLGYWDNLGGFQPFSQKVTGPELSTSGAIPTFNSVIGRSVVDNPLWTIGGGTTLAGGAGTKFTVADGEAGSPSISFTSEGGSGMYRAGTGIIRLASQTTDAFEIDANEDVSIMAGDLSVDSGDVTVSGHITSSGGAVYFGSGASVDKNGGASLGYRNETGDFRTFDSLEAAVTPRDATAPLEISSNNVSLTVFLPVEGINQLVTVDGKTHLYADSSKVTITESQITDLSHTVDTTRDATAPLEIDTNNVSLTVFLPVEGINQLVTVDGKTHLYADSSKVTVTESQITDLSHTVDTTRDATAPLEIATNNVSLTVFLPVEGINQLVTVDGKTHLYADSSKVTITESQISDFGSYGSGTVSDADAPLVVSGSTVSILMDSNTGLASNGTYLGLDSTKVTPSASNIQGTLDNLNTALSSSIDESSDPRDPNAHESSHRTGGSDAIGITTILGQHTDPQLILAGNGVASPAAVDTILTGGLLSPTTSGTATTISVTATTIENAISLANLSSRDYGDLTGVPASFSPSAHESSHRTGGSDAIGITTILGQHTDPQLILAGNGVASPAAVDTILTGGLLSPTTSGTATTISVTATTIADAISLSDYADTTDNVSFSAGLSATFVTADQIGGLTSVLYGDGSHITGLAAGSGPTELPDGFTSLAPTAGNTVTTLYHLGVFDGDAAQNFPTAQSFPSMLDKITAGANAFRVGDEVTFSILLEEVEDSTAKKITVRLTFSDVLKLQGSSWDIADTKSRIELRFRIISLGVSAVAFGTISKVQTGTTTQLSVGSFTFDSTASHTINVTFENLSGDSVSTLELFAISGATLRR